MQLKKKLQAKVQKFLEGPAVQKLRQSAPVRIVGRGIAVCQAHPFPTAMLLLLLYRLALDLLYLTTLSPLFEYTGYTTELMPLPYLTSWAALLVFVPFVAGLIGRTGASSLLVTFINYFYFIPITSYFGCKGTVEIWFFIITLVYWALLLFWQYRIPVLYLKPLSKRQVKVVMVILTVVSCLLVFLISGKYTGFRFTLNFLDVYGIREEATSYRMPAVVSYLLSMMPIILTTLFLFWLRQKRYVPAVILGVTYIFLFSISAHKSVFFFFFLAILCFFFLRRWMLNWAPGLLAVLAGTAMLEYRGIGTFYLMSLFFRRMMYVPGSISERYLKFFSENPINFFRNGIMGKFHFKSIYSTGIARLLGEFCGNPDTNANNGLLGDMFANLPILLGLLLMPLLLILCFRLMDLATEKVPLKYLVPFCVFFASAFMNGSWGTVLLTHGFLVACLLLYIFPREEGLSQ